MTYTAPLSFLSTLDVGVLVNLEKKTCTPWPVFFFIYLFFIINLLFWLIFCWLLYRQVIYASYFKLEPGSR